MSGLFDPFQWSGPPNPPQESEPRRVIFTGCNTPNCPNCGRAALFRFYWTVISNTFTQIATARFQRYYAVHDRARRGWEAVNRAVYDPAEQVL